VDQFESSHEQFFVLACGNGWPPSLPTLFRHFGAIKQSAKNSKHNQWTL
jgi:hypothetical protein